MGKFRLQINTYYGEMSIEGDSLDELKNLLVQIGLSSETITTVLTSAVNQMERKDSITRISMPIAPSKPEQAGIIEYQSDGTPHISVSTDKLSAREVIGLLLYAKSPSAVSLNELTRLMADNWKNYDISSVSANLVQMKAFVIKEGERGSYAYRLSGSGKNWIENELLPKLKSKT